MSGERFPTNVFAGQIVYHGTSVAAARNILTHDINLRRCDRGYFGLGFYTAVDESLARSNYAGASGAVVKLVISRDARILDLRDPRGLERVYWYGVTSLLRESPRTLVVG